MINFKGSLVSGDAPIFGPNERGFVYGDALHEEIKVVNGHIYFWEEHYLRLMASMRILRMEIPMDFTLEFLEEQVASLLKANHLQDSAAFVRISVYRKTGDQLLPEDNEVSYVITCQEGPRPFYTLSDEAYEVELFKDFYLTADMLSTLPTNNQILRVTGSIYARENRYQDCLLLNAQKNVVQSLYGNLFLLQGGLIKTAPLSEGCGDGIIRRKLIDNLNNSDEYQLQEAAISPFELQKADGMFISNIRVGIQPITKYRKAAYASDVYSQLIGRLNAAARLG